jgi:SAM-dependent methyltransferase
MPVHDRYPHFVKDQRQFFDELVTEDWHTYISPDWDYVRRYEIDRLFRRVRPATILDVGCGCGFHDLKMADYPFVREVVGIDYSSKSIEAAEREYAHPKVNRIACDFMEYPRQRVFDLVVSFQVIEHLENPDAFMAFCRDVCAEGGHVAVFTPNRLRWRNRVLRVRGRREQLCDTQHDREYAIQDLRRLAAPARLVAAGWFGYTLAATGVPWIDRRRVETRTALGRWLPWAANGICMLFRRHGGS